MGVCLYVRLAARDDAAARGLGTLLAHTPAGVPVLVGGPAAEPAWLAALPGGERLREASAPPPDGDVVVVDAATEVAEGWLDGLRAAAAEATGPVATASPLTAGPGATALAGPLPDPLELASAAAAVRARAARLRPRLAAPVPACMLATRAAIELAGPLDDGFAARCTAAGLLHVAADDVLVRVPGAALVPEPLPEEQEWRRERDDAEPLGRARALARRAVAGLALTIDGRSLSGSMAGTQVHTLELVAALHRSGAAALRVIVPPDLSPPARAALAELDGVELLPAVGIDQDTPRADVVHRPFQVSSANDAKLLQRAGRRRVVTHQDLLGYHNPTYHATPSAWEGHRRLTRAALASADAVVAFSAHVAADLLAEDLVEAHRLEHVPIGVDHRLDVLRATPRQPDGVDASVPFVACVGTDLRHKNRMFALALLAAMRERGWPGRLVLAGGHARAGGSAADEVAWRRAQPEAADAVIDLGQVEEDVKAWLYEQAAAVLYPTTSEGFGLIPFEAAQAGTPCLHAGGSSLDELLPGTATLQPWDAAASAERALALLGDPVESRALVDRIAAAGRELTWDRTAEQLLALYDTVLTRPPTPSAAAAWLALGAEDRRGHVEGLHYELLETIGPTGLALVGEQRLLPEDAQRTLAGLARRPATRGPLLRLLSGLRRVVARGD